MTFYKCVSSLKSACTPSKFVLIGKTDAKDKRSSDRLHIKEFFQRIKLFDSNNEPGNAAIQILLILLAF